MTAKSRSAVAMACLVTLAFLTAGVQGPSVHWTEGKEITDSLAAAADTFGTSVLADDMDSLHIWAANDSLVLYTVQVSPDGGTSWYTLDTTSVTAANVGTVFAIPAQYAGRTWRLIADNQTATTCYARVFVASFR